MKTLRVVKMICGLFLLSSVLAPGGEKQIIMPWNKSYITPPDYARYTSVATPEQRAEKERQMGFIYVSGQPPSPVKHEVAATEQEGLQKIINRKVEAIMRPEFFSPAAGELVTFHRVKTDDPQHPRSLKFHISYIVDGYRVAINGGVASMKVDSVRVFIGRENEYPVAEDVFKVVPTTVTKENIRVREGGIVGQRPPPDIGITELKGLAVEFRDPE